MANPTVRQAWPPSALLHTPGLGTAVSGRPVVNYSFALNQALNRILGVDAAHETVSFHAVNILLHIIAALMLCAVIRRTFRHGRVPESWRSAGDWIAMIVSGIWLLHPLQTEAVDYVSQRTELMVSVCYLGVLYASIRAWGSAARNAARNAARWSIAAVAISVAGMCSKEVMITAPLMVMLYDRAFLSAGWREMWSNQRRRALYVALVATMACAIGLVLAGGRAKTVGFDLGVTWYQYLYSQAWAITHYLRLLAWPDSLTYDYGSQPVRGPGGVPGLVGLSAIAIATLAAWRRPSWYWLGFLGAWFFLLLAPSSSIVPIRTEIAAERRVYLAIAAVVVLIVIGIEYARRTLVQKSGLPRCASRLAAATGVAFGVLMVAATFARSALYQDTEALWRDAARKRPSNARAFDNLAATNMRADPPRLDAADSLLRRAISVDSSYVPALVRLAAVDIKRARLADAESLLTRALRIDPGDSAATDKLGKVLLAIGRPDRAFPYVRQLADFSPSAEALTTLGATYLLAHQLDSAAHVLARAVALDPMRLDAREYLGGALIEQGRGAEALPHVEQAVRLNPQSADDIGMLSLAYAQAGMRERSIQAANAIESGANSGSAFVFAGRAMQSCGRFADAARYFERAVRLDPSDAQAITRLGIAEASLGNTPLAARLLRHVLSAAPDYSLAREALDHIERGDVPP